MLCELQHTSHLKFACTVMLPSCHGLDSALSKPLMCTPIVPLICCVYIKWHLPICVNAHCMMLEVLRYIALNALNTVQKVYSMSKMSKIDQTHLCPCHAMYVGDVEDGERTYTQQFWLITSLILNGFSIWKKIWKAETESFPTIPSNFMYVKGCRR